MTYAAGMIGAVIYTLLVLAIGWWLARPRPMKRHDQPPRA